jgi:hypothetical protein
MTASSFNTAGFFKKNLNLYSAHVRVSLENCLREGLCDQLRACQLGSWGWVGGLECGMESPVGRG